jgi:hypothetical protein
MLISLSIFLRLPVYNQTYKLVSWKIILNLYQTPGVKKTSVAYIVSPYPSDFLTSLTFLSPGVFNSRA